MSPPPLFLGIDIGTSGCRAIAIDKHGVIHGRVFVACPLPQSNGHAVEQNPIVWWNALQTLFNRLARQIPLPQIAGLSIDGTSGSIIVTDGNGIPLHPALMYNDARAIDQAQRIAQIAPLTSAAHGASSGLAKSLWLLEHLQQQTVSYIQNQSDWIVGQLSGHFGLSDINNCSKLGYDAMNGQWPTWLNALHVPLSLLPSVYIPGTFITSLSRHAADITGLQENTPIFAGTTDSTAAVYATGAQKIGDAITSLGSTLVTKVISDVPIFLPSAGVYSQPFGEHWLAGGGSNSGGNVLLHFFTPAQMDAMSAKINPHTSPQLNYYPLLSPGERFPICDPTFTPQLTPRPKDDILFFHGMLEGIANIEKQAYQLLAELGAPCPTRVFSAGGGASNTAWTQIRAKILDTQILLPIQQDAAYGVAKIARDGYLKLN